MIRSDQIGSLLRPPALLQARAAHAAGEIDADALRAAEDEAILHLLDRQRAIGIDVVTDGELRRAAWQTNVSEAVDGFVDASRTMTWHGADGSVTRSLSYSKVIGGRLQARRRIAGTDAAFLAAHADRPYKVTMPSPVLVAGAGWADGTTDEVYRDRDELLADVVGLVGTELAALAAGGVGYLQLDEGFTPFVGTDWLEAMPDPAGALDRAIDAENAAFAHLEGAGVAGAPVVRAIHICRGNHRSRWTAAGGYDALAEQVFNRLDVDRFLLEYDSERAGGFEPLRHVPGGKVAVLGLVSTKTGELEGRDQILRRVDEAQRHAPLDRLALSPQCGFASTELGNLLTEDEQWRKLELVVSVAREIWG
ncbi:MAG: hypothetical protein R2761_22655 [Acidimicrobiales bacterium]